MTDMHSPPVLTAEQLAAAFGSNTRVIARQTAGLTHADSLLQPPMRGNCLNWVLGHIAVHRDYVLEALGEEKVLGEGPVARYDLGSAPILGEEEGVLPLETLLAAINQAQKRIAAALARVSEADLAKEAPKSEPNSVARQVTFLYWHETYHTGQTEYLRQLAGTDDQVI
jgi:hypothetical protein